MKNIKKMAILLAVCLLVVSVFAFASCTKDDGGGDIVIDPNGTIKPGGTVTNINFWGWGDENETEVFTAIVDAFNKKYENVIHVNYVQRPSSSYSESLLTTLAGSKGPDVFYVQDNYFKQYASLGYLADITEYFNASTTLDESDMFPNTISRYRYNTVTTTSNSDDPLYALPKDLAPTAIYYNVTQFKKAGVTIISMTEEEALAAGYTVRGYDPATKTFNNKIAMSWSDLVALSQLLMTTGASQYGFFSEWWFNYGWSVGGDCIEYIETDDAAFNGGYYKFTLNDSTKNYIVKDDFTGTITVNGNSYSAGEIISYTDKALLTDSQKADCNELPSQREAFTEFVRLSQPTTQVVDNVNGVYDSNSDFYGADANGNLYGYGITPSPSAISTDGKVGYFTSGKVAMLFNTMSSVKNIRANMKDDWDVAPALVYKEYSEDGKSVTVHGVPAAHSGSVAIAVNAKSTKKQAAYLLAEFIASAEGQTLQAEAGFAIPLQISVANSEVYLDTSKKPANIAVFIDACYYETPGDWWYLKDKKWIDNWQSVLNGDVRNGKKTLTDFYNHEYFIQTQSLLDAYTAK